ncbi:ricin B-like lectin R40G3 [Hibiscus syriacus]|uniref:ricin B-like lectin R40G3 n=1 Tax=Hibiscus syriacus TaxID=106335 RepID=UPI0019208E3D|nr:ricin B-like lectin R40G3 [Hibiscus syriacus]
MECPFGHNHSQTRHHWNDDEDNRERPPPQHLHHHEFPPPCQHYPPTPNYHQPPAFRGPYPPPPPNYHQPPALDGPYPPPPPSSYFQQHAFDGPTPPYFQQPGFPSPPPHQPPTHEMKWYKDEKFSTRVKDQVGFPSFSLANKATGQVIKHSIGASHPVQLVPYKPDLDESVLWSESKEVHDGYRAIRMINNIRLNLDAFHGDKKSGGIHNGTTIVLWQWNKGDNQIWRIAPYC